MRVLSIGNFTTGWDGSICDEEHLAKAMEELGVEVVRWQREKPSFIVYGKGKTRFDFILIAQWDGYSDSLLSQLKQYECPTVYWAFDYQNDDQEWHQRLIKEADLYLSKPFKDSKYENWAWLSQDFSPPFLD